jgi:O-antigen/teichoic acid export membrane protein
MTFLPRLRIILASPSLLGAAQTLGIKAGGAVLALVMFNLAARALGENAFGHLAVWFNVASFLAVCAVCGQDTFIVRSWHEYGNGRDPTRAKGAYIFGWCVASALALMICFGLGAVSLLRLLPLYQGETFALMLFVLSQTLLHYASHACRTIVHFRVSEINREIIWRLGVIAVLAVIFSTGRPYNDVIFFLSAAAGMLAGVVLQCWYIRQNFPVDVRQSHARFTPVAWFKTALGMWSSATLEAASQYIDVVLIGLLVHPTVAGGYFVAVRIANVFPMLAAGMHSFLASKMAAHFYDGQQAELQTSIRQVIGAVAAAVVSLFMGIMIFGHDLLTLFGVEYSAMYGPLMVLASGTAFFTLTGPHSVLLLTTGHEHTYLRASMVAFVARVGLLLVMVPWLGAWGAALAWSGTVVPLGIWLVIVCRRRIGVNPSVSSWLI